MNPRTLIRDSPLKAAPLTGLGDPHKALVNIIWGIKYYVKFPLKRLLFYKKNNNNTTNVKVKEVKEVIGNLAVLSILLFDKDKILYVGK